MGTVLKPDVVELHNPKPGNSVTHGCYLRVSWRDLLAPPILLQTNLWLQSGPHCLTPSPVFEPGFLSESALYVPC